MIPWKVRFLFLMLLFTSFHLMTELSFGDNSGERANVVPWLNQLSAQTWSAPKGGLVVLPSGDRPFLIVAFRTCCPSNKMALKWAAERKNEFGDSLGVLAFAVENPRQAKKVISWVKALNLNFPVAVPESPELRASTGIMATPAIILLDRSGMEVLRTEFLTEKALKEFEQILKKYKESQ